MTIVELAGKIAEQLETRERVNGEKFVALKDGYPQWMQDVIHKAHGDRLPDDDVYKRISSILDTIAELDTLADYDTIVEAIDTIEPDIYTNALTGWLHSRNDNIFYLDEALAEYGTFKTGSDLLTAAQSIYIREIVYALLDALKEQSETNE